MGGAGTEAVAGACGHDGGEGGGEGGGERTASAAGAARAERPAGWIVPQMELGAGRPKDLVEHAGLLGGVGGQEDLAQVLAHPPDGGEVVRGESLGEFVEIVAMQQPVDDLDRSETILGFFELVVRVDEVDGGSKLGCGPNQ